MRDSQCRQRKLGDLLQSTYVSHHAPNQRKHDSSIYSD